MICSTVPEEEKQNHEEGVKSWLHIIVRWTRVGRHSEGVSHVPACPVVVVAEADRQHRGPRANPGGRANAPDSGCWRHRSSRNSTESGSKTALSPALSPGDRRAREPVGRCPPGRSPALGSQFTRPAHLAARSRRSPAGILTSARAPSPVPPTPRAPPTSPRAPACFHLLWPRGRSAVAGRAAPEDRWRRRGITPPPLPRPPRPPPISAASSPGSLCAAPSPPLWPSPPAPCSAMVLR